jgi:hypothetical protein
MKNILPQSHPYIFLLMNNLGGVLINNNKFLEAEEIFNECLKIQNIEKHHTCKLMNNLGFVLINLKKM